jgi:hypothetical protein
VGLAFGGLLAKVSREDAFLFSHHLNMARAILVVQLIF